MVSGLTVFLPKANKRLTTSQQELLALKKQCKALEQEVMMCARNEEPLDLRASCKVNQSATGSSHASDEGAMARRHAVSGLLDKLKETVASNEAQNCCLFGFVCARPDTYSVVGTCTVSAGSWQVPYPSES